MENSQDKANHLKTLSAEWFPKTSFHNLNAGATSPTPKPVFDIAEAQRRQIAADPVQVIWHDMLVAIEESRRTLANYLNGSWRQLLLLQNTSMAINTVLRSFPWQQGDEVVLTDQEYNHYYPLWQTLQQAYSLSIKTVILPTGQDTTPQEIEKNFAAQVTPKTRMIYASHVSTATGMQLPVKQLAALARRSGAHSLFDGAHAAGMVPVDLEAIDADFYAGTAHKWLMAPVGTGFLYVAKRARPLVSPLIITDGIAYDQAASEESHTPSIPLTNWLRSFEYQGTQDRSAQVVITKALSLRDTIGESVIQEHTAHLRAKIIQHLELRNLPCLSPSHPDLRTGMVTFEVGNVDRIKTWMWFRDRGFDVGLPMWSSHPKTIMRLSAAWFVEEEDIDRFFEMFDLWKSSYK